MKNHPLAVPVFAARPFASPKSGGPLRISSAINQFPDVSASIERRKHRYERRYADAARNKKGTGRGLALMQNYSAVPKIVRTSPRAHAIVDEL